MSPRRALLAAITASLLVLAAPVAAAQATSCVGTEEVLVGAKAAFIGVVTDRDGDQLTFDVSDVFRGDLPDPFVVREDIPSAGVADPFRVGAEVGLVVYQRDGELLINECGVVPPARLHQARAEGWPRGLLYPRRRLLAVRGDSAGLTVFCSLRCVGTIVLLTDDDTLLGRARVDLRRGTERVSLRLTPAAQRRLARDPSLPVRFVVRLAPARRPVVHRLTLVRGRG